MNVKMFLHERPDSKCAVPGGVSKPVYLVIPVFWVQIVLEWYSFSKEKNLSRITHPGHIVQGDVFGFKGDKVHREWWGNWNWHGVQSSLGFWLVSNALCGSWGQDIAERRLIHPFTFLFLKVASSLLHSSFWNICQSVRVAGRKNTDNRLELISPFWVMSSLFSVLWSDWSQNRMRVWPTK